MKPAMLLFQLISYPLFLTLHNTRASWVELLRSPRQLSLPFLSWSHQMTAWARLRNSSTLVDRRISLDPHNQVIDISILSFFLHDITNIWLFVLIHMGRTLGQTVFISVSTIVTNFSSVWGMLSKSHLFRLLLHRPFSQLVAVAVWFLSAIFYRHFPLL